MYTELSSGFKSLLMLLELAKMLNVEFNGEDIKNRLLGFKNKDGGFGENGHSNISSTYYAVASLCLLKHNRENLRSAVEFVRKCESPHGGFTIIPNSLKTYMEFTYAGVMTLDLLLEKMQISTKNSGFRIKMPTRKRRLRQNGHWNIHPRKYVSSSQNIAKTGHAIEKSKIKTRLQKISSQNLQYPSRLLDTNCDSATLNYF
ncbi:MAG: prenyltransferase/squalene oxidase repeat-containing protein, partial [Candidatus Freyarchaeota archaeon]